MARAFRILPDYKRLPSSPPRHRLSPPLFRTRRVSILWPRLFESTLSILTTSLRATRVDLLFFSSFRFFPAVFCFSVLFYSVSRPSRSFLFFLFSWFGFNRIPPIAKRSNGDSKFFRRSLSALPSSIEPPLLIFDSTVISAFDFFPRLLTPKPEKRGMFMAARITVTFPDWLRRITNFRFWWIRNVRMVLLVFLNLVEYNIDSHVWG